MATDFGKVFEDQLEDVFRSLKESHLLGWHRFPDTHSAGAGGNILQPQPSDYLLGLPPGGGVGKSNQRLIFFEAKATEKYKTLQKAAVSAEQRGFIHFYHGLLHLPYLICHYSAVTGEIQIWNGRALMDARIDKQHLLCSFDAGQGRNLNIAETARALTAVFCLPDKLSTLKLYK